MPRRDEMVSFANFEGKIYVETNNNLTFLSDAFARAYPNSKFIHLHRHPYEVIRSGIRRRWYCGDRLDRFKIHPMSDDPCLKDWNSYSDIEKNAWHWKQVNQVAAAFIKKLHDYRGFTLPAKKLFEGDSKTIRNLFQFLGVKVPKKDKIQKTLKLKLNAQKTGLNWTSDEWLQEDKRRIITIVGTIAKDYGYQL